MMPWAKQKGHGGPTGATTNPTSDYAGTTGTDHPTRTAGTDYSGTDTHHDKKKGSKFGKAMSVPIALTWLLALASWITAVGGLIALTVSCHDGDSFGGAGATGRTGFLGLLSSLPYTGAYDGCVQVMQFQWFHLALELFVLTLTFLTIMQRLRGFRYAAIGLLAVVTVFMMQDTDLFLGFSTRVYNLAGHNKVWDRSAVTFAGFVGMSAFNLLLIILLGAGRRQDAVRRSVAPHDDAAGYGGQGYGNTYNTAGHGVRDDRPQVGVTGPGYGRSPEVV